MLHNQSEAEAEKYTAVRREKGRHWRLGGSFPDGIMQRQSISCSFQISTTRGREKSQPGGGIYHVSCCTVVDQREREQVIRKSSRVYFRYLVNPDKDSKCHCRSHCQRGKIVLYISILENTLSQQVFLLNKNLNFRVLEQSYMCKIYKGKVYIPKFCY